MRKKPTAPKKKPKRKRKENEGESDDTNGVKVIPPSPPKSTITPEVPTGEANKAGVFY
jgi:hypothetical protein